MWKVSRFSCSSRLRPSRQGSSTYTLGYRGFRSDTGRNLNANTNGNGSNGTVNSGKLVGERIVIDPKTKMRMDLRKETIGDSNGKLSSGKDKWAQSPDHAARVQESPFRRAYEESMNRSSRTRGGGKSNSGQQNKAQESQRLGRFYNERNGSSGRQNPPSSFATSSAWGFSAPTPSATPKSGAPSPSSSTKPSASRSSAPSPSTAAVPKPSNVTQTSSSTTNSAPSLPPTPQRTSIEATNEVKSALPAAPAPAVPSPKAVPLNTVNPAASSPNSSTSAASNPTPIAPIMTREPALKQGTQTFVRSTRTAKENAQIQVEQRSRKRRQQQKPPKDVFIPEAISVSNLAGLLGARIGHFENTMKTLGMEIIRHDHILTSEEASLLALEYNVNPIIGTTEKLFDLTSQPEPEDMSIHPLRPPVVTIMGHVDHGKTTLLDSLRKTSVAAGEAGGITQHIGAFSVILPSKQRITFLDTPGHAAFSAMRARGAHTTDIVVLVVAAEDGVMPQTAEAIKHAEDAGVPIIVAINKCDKYGAEPDKAKQALLKHGITVEDLGGETQCVEVSGLTGKNLDKLEEAILTLAEVLDLRAEVDLRGEGHVIESQIEKGRGNVATVLVKRGTLRVGDTIVAGDAWCKVKALVNDTGKNVKEAPPGTPVKVMGWKDLPMAGDEMLGAESEEQAKLAVANRALKKERQEQLKALVAINEKRRITAEEEDEEKEALKEFKRKTWLFHQGMLDTYPDPPQVKKQLSVAAMAAKEEEESEVKNLRMVVKGDVSGTVEAVCDALSGLPANQVKVGVIQSGVGNITESDIQFASSCNGFNVKADKKLLQTARQMGVSIKSYNIIYKLLDDVKIEMATLLPKDIEIQVVGEAKIAQVFPIKMKGQTQNVAGCRITNGGVTRKEDVRIVRNGEVIWNGRLATLKRVKDDVQEAKKGTECGMEFDGFQDFKEGDVIQSIKKMEVLRKL
ncbi:hypothetical protein BGZ80_007535 [Entomortierella chlamydospora]|uniref:Translation initiation factor IF-2, mitochondrial n=1 Tax=Entomortierella chlamydospora TaxID=101097 RepID=A0A9P6T208_9FUNG|nr:hypothetical protein BGZ80_007535 [Entomortierella chlamydospora]